MVKLSKRLQMIADRVPLGGRLADIGSDHALLPTYLAERGMISFAIAGEVNPGPLEAAAKQVKEAGLTQIISVRSGNGLQVIMPREVEVITIAGMGGSLIVSILTEGKEKLEGVGTLILQPNVGEDHVRRWLDAEGWFLVDETILEEDGKIYEILTAKTSSGEQANQELYVSRILPDGLVLGKERLLQMGPYFVERAPEVWFTKWEQELEKLDMICRQLENSSSDTSRNKGQSIRNEMIQIKEVLHCLQKAKP